MRIKTIALMLKGANTLLDIGTDHGEVIIEAFKLGYIKKAIASDINAGPLKRAFNNINNAGLSDKVTFIQTDGFKDINIEYDAVAITGLGYNTIKDILTMPHQKPKFYVFGVQSELEEFRSFLSVSGYKIVEEEIVKEKRFYVFIKAVKEEAEKQSYEDIILGPFLKEKKESVPFYEKKALEIKEKIPYFKDEELKDLKEKLDIYLKAINKLF